METFKKVIADNAQFKADIDGAMKSNNLDAEVDKFFYQERDKEKKAAKGTASKKA